MTAKTKNPPAKTVDEYIKGHPAPVQTLLQKVRKTIRAAAPGAEEVISYSLPAYKYHGMLIFFSGWKEHISLYPAPRQQPEFKKELEGYKGGKGTVQFPLDKPIPFDLITRIVKFRMKENEAAAARKAQKTGKANPVKKTQKPGEAEQVAAYMQQLEHKLKPEAEALRNIIKKTDKKLSERIKWNAPSYYYKEDLFTFNVHKKEQLLIVFHHPAIVKINSSLLQGKYKDRRLMYFNDMKEIKAAKKELERIIKELIKAADKNKK